MTDVRTEHLVDWLTLSVSNYGKGLVAQWDTITSAGGFVQLSFARPTVVFLYKSAGPTVGYLQHSKEEVAIEIPNKCPTYGHV